MYSFPWKSQCESVDGIHKPVYECFIVRCFWWGWTLFLHIMFLLFLHIMGTFQEVRYKWLNFFLSWSFYSFLKKNKLPFTILKHYIILNYILTCLWLILYAKTYKKFYKINNNFIESVSTFNRTLPIVCQLY